MFPDSTSGPRTGSPEKLFHVYCGIDSKKILDNTVHKMFTVEPSCTTYCHGEHYLRRCGRTTGTVNTHVLVLKCLCAIDKFGVLPLLKWLYYRPGYTYSHGEHYL